MKKILLIIIVNVCIFISISIFFDFVFIKFKSNKVISLKRYIDNDTLNHVFAKNYSTSLIVHDSIPEYNFETNFQRLRSKNNIEYSYDKSNIFRILILGDSFVEGFEFSKTLPSMLGKLLIENNYKNDSIQVINAGVGSYSPMIHFFNYKYFLYQLKPDLVILAIDVTDLRDDYCKYNELLWHDETGAPGGIFTSVGGTPKKINKTIITMLNNSQVFSKYWAIAFIAKNSQIFKHYFFIPRLHRYYRKFIKDESLNVPDYFYDYIGFANGNYTKSSNAYELTFSYVLKLNNLILDNNSNLLLSIYPHYNMLIENDFKYFDKWTEFAKKNDIKIYSLLNDILILDNYSNIYLQNDMHFNYSGTRLWAKKLSEYLLKKEK